MKKMFCILFIVLLASSCVAQKTTEYQKTITVWPTPLGPSLPYHIKVISDDFWYEIMWDGRVISIISSFEQDYASWDDDRWRELINWCYVNDDHLKILKL
jgi:hypothetical protein